MRFNPMSDEEAAAQSANLLPDGTYDYEVRTATEETSQAGNEMTKIEAWIYDKDGARRLVFDYLVASEKAAWKIHEFAASCGLLEKYKTGTLEAIDIEGRAGKCVVATQKATDTYPAKNVIRRYVKAAASAAPATRRQPAMAGGIDDEIPF
jgi:hypothetical protein